MKKFTAFLLILLFATTSHAEETGEFSDKYPTVKSAFKLTHDVDIVSVITICSILYEMIEMSSESELAKLAASLGKNLADYQVANKTPREKAADLNRLAAFESEIKDLIGNGGINRLILLSHCGIVDKKTRSIFE